MSHYPQHPVELCQTIYTRILQGALHILQTLLPSLNHVTKTWNLFRHSHERTTQSNKATLIATIDIPSFTSFTIPIPNDGLDDNSISWLEFLDTFTNFFCDT
jgi:hypothetical protein